MTRLNPFLNYEQNRIFALWNKYLASDKRSFIEYFKEEHNIDIGETITYTDLKNLCKEYMPQTTSENVTKSHNLPLKVGKSYPTHTNIIVDVPIPYKWENVSYHNDVCPSFSFKGLQIFICDEQTRKEEGFGEKYTIIIEAEYGEAKDPLLATNDWNKVLDFVHKFNMRIYKINKDIDVLEKFKHEIRLIPQDDFACEDVLDLLDPIIRAKEDELLEEQNKWIK